MTWTACSGSTACGTVTNSSTLIAGSNTHCSATTVVGTLIVHYIERGRLVAVTGEAGCVGVEFQVLGPLRVIRDGRELILRTARKPRLVLAAMLARADEPVSTDWLVEMVWDEHPPSSARRNVQQYVQQLRLSLGADRIVSHANGYKVVTDGNLDAARFRTLAAEGNEAWTRRDPARAARTIRRALDLWRGPAFADFTDCPAIAAKATQLEQLRLACLEQWAESELACGRHADIVAELTDVVGAQPFHEGLAGHLMLALYRSGRQSEALAVYHGAHDALTGQLGVEPASGLRDLHRRILSADPTLDQPSVARRPLLLPPDVPDFTGRTEDLAWLDRAADATGRTVVISAIAGMGGVGKTALAVRWAYRARDRFPDGQLYLDLRGYSAGEPVRPIDALVYFLRALGIARNDIPSDETGAVNLYRTTIAEKRVLILLDNAHSADQVRPMLPTGPGSLAIVTSRDGLAGLIARQSARRLTLDVLPADDAVRLLSQILGAGTGAADLARACGYLPLAMRVAAATLADQPVHVISEYAATLRAGDRIESLAIHGDADSSVRYVFDRSYQALSGPEQRMFRLLGLVPAADITAAAAAALASLPSGEAEAILARLESAHLVEQQAPGRYAMHDLVHEYAAGLATGHDPEAGRQAALERLLMWYLGHVEAANRHLHPRNLTLPPSGYPVHLESPNAATQWFNAEMGNLIASVEHASKHNLPRLAAWIACGARIQLFKRGTGTDMRRIADAGVAAAVAAGDVRAEALLHLAIAEACFTEGRHHDGLSSASRFHELLEDVDWPEARAAALNLLAVLHLHLGNLNESAGYLEAAIAGHDAATLHRQGAVDLLKHYGDALHRLGLVNMLRGDLTAAASLLEQALFINRLNQHGDHSLATDLVNLGAVYRLQGRHDVALECITEALECYRRTGHPQSMTHGQIQHARVLHDLGRPAEAMSVVSDALRVLEGTAVGVPTVHAWVTRAGILTSLGQSEAAIGILERAEGVASALPNRHTLTEVLIGLALAHRASGDLAAAELAARRARELASENGYRLLLGQALDVLHVLRYHPFAGVLE